MQEQTPSTPPAEELEQQRAQAGTNPAAAHVDSMPSLEESLRQAELKASEHHDAWLRAKAETENVRRRAQEEVTKASKFAAEKFAKDSDSKLGKISSAYQGQFSIEDRDANTPYLKHVRVVTSVVYYLKN